MAHTAQRRFGQNFLIDANIAKKIVKAAQLQPSETVVEIGPGKGALTRLLADTAREVIAIELDRTLNETLEQLVAEHPTIKIVHGDALKVYGGVVKKCDQFVVVANIPYNITASLIRMFLETKPTASRIIIMVQKEVATRMTAKVGDMSLLALSVQLYADVRRCFDVSPSAFRPRPKVWSSVVEIVPHTLVADIDPEEVLAVARIAFSKKRKLLASNLAGEMDVSRDEIIAAMTYSGVQHNARAQDLSINQWRTLAKALR